MATAGKQDKLNIQTKSIKTAMSTMLGKLMIFTDLTFWIMKIEGNFVFWNFETKILDFTTIWRSGNRYFNRR